MFYPEEITALFVDGYNYYNTTKALGFTTDYIRLKDYIGQQCRLQRATYFTTLVERDLHVAVRPMIDFLQYNGWSVVTKKAREFTGEDGQRKFRGTTDIELAIAASRMAPRIHHAVLFTGNQDFCPLVEHLQDQGVRVSVASTIKTSPVMIADELRREADNFIELDDLRRVIARKERADSAA